MNLYACAAALEKSKLNAAFCTVVAISGSTPRKPGAKMIVTDNFSQVGDIMGTIGGGAIEHAVRAEAIQCIRANRSKLLEVSLKNELGMCCGGIMSIFIEPIAKKPKLICFGAGHIAQALCPQAIMLGYDVLVVDERKDLLHHDAFINAEKHDDTSSFSFKDMPFFSETYVVITTHDHALDQHIAEQILPLEFKYAALVGSQRKALMTKKRLQAKDMPMHLIEKLICPAGLFIFAQTPQEIALSILAQMTSVKNGNGITKTGHL